jgi:hypothetical protein
VEPSAKNHDIGAVVMALIMVIAVYWLVERGTATSPVDAQHKLEQAQQECRAWQAELADHPEYYKTTEIENTEKKTKRLCTDAINDAELDLEGARIRAEKAKQQEAGSNR